MQPAALVYRGHALESLHAACVAVVDADARLVAWCGDPRRVIVSRSTLKPFQAAPSILSGALDRWRLSPQELAIMCGSHNGTDAHRDVVRRILGASGRGAADLRCGSHPPLYGQYESRVPPQEQAADSLRHNCSGKHAGFLTQAAHLGDPPGSYLFPGSATQQQVRSFVARHLEVEASALEPVTDGCSAPNYAVPLDHLARAYLRLVQGRGWDAASGRALTRCRDAMWAHPEMVSGEGRFDLAMARAFPGNALCKVGGEAVEVMAFRDPPLSVAVKILDGNMRAVGPVCLEVLRQLGVCPDPASHPGLGPHARPRLRNDAGLEVGHIEASLQLERA